MLLAAQARVRATQRDHERIARQVEVRLVPGVTQLLDALAAYEGVTRSAMIAMLVYDRTAADEADRSTGATSAACLGPVPGGCG